MSYNLLLDTEFQKIHKRWKLTNCTYDSGYLKGKSNLYSIEQTITLPDPTKLYLSFDYITFDPNIKSIQIGIQSDDVLKVSKKAVKLHKRTRISVIDDV